MVSSLTNSDPKQATLTLRPGSLLNGCCTTVLMSMSFFCNQTRMRVAKLIWTCAGMRVAPMEYSVGLSDDIMQLLWTEDDIMKRFRLADTYHLQPRPLTARTVGNALTHISSERPKPCRPEQACRHPHPDKAGSHIIQTCLTDAVRLICMMSPAAQQPNLDDIKAPLF